MKANFVYSCCWVADEAHPAAARTGRRALLDREQDTGAQLSLAVARYEHPSGKKLLSVARLTLASRPLI